MKVSRNTAIRWIPLYGICPIVPQRVKSQKSVHHITWRSMCVQIHSLMFIRIMSADTHLPLSFPFFSFPSLMWAHCGVMSSGCVSIRNFTIRFMPIPIIDASQALKASPEKTEDALLKVCQELSMVLQASSCLVIVLHDFNSVTCYVQQL